MSEIRTSKGQIVLVDDDLYEELNRKKWHVPNSLRYAQRRIALPSGKSSSLYMHRAIMGCTRGDGLYVDHINRNTLDNRRENLRVLTAREQGHNKGSRPGSSSRYRGVSWDSDRHLWAASVQKKLDSGKMKKFHLGRFSSELEAAKAAREARKHLLPYSTD